jgi:hypothetical protein
VVQEKLVETVVAPEFTSLVSTITGNLNDQLTITKGNNNLDTCFQYRAKDNLGFNVMNVKFYDKVIDLISREGSHNIGSRFRHIIGSSRSMGTFEERLRAA